MFFSRDSAKTENDWTGKVTFELNQHFDLQLSVPDILTDEEVAEVAKDIANEGLLDMSSEEIDSRMKEWLQRKRATVLTAATFVKYISTV